MIVVYCEVQGLKPRSLLRFTIQKIANKASTVTREKLHGVFLGQENARAFSLETTDFSPWIGASGDFLLFFFTGLWHHAFVDMYIQSANVDSFSLNYTLY